MGTPVTKELFSQNKTKEKCAKSSTKDVDTLQIKGGWYCYGCEEDRMADMRQCTRCGKWYHEECVGLSALDLDSFECPDGC